MEKLINLPDGSTAIITINKPGCPNGGEHEWDGPGYHFVSWLEDGEMCEKIGGKENETQEDIQHLDEILRAEGKYISGGECSCSKCGIGYTDYDNPYYSEM